MDRITTMDLRRARPTDADAITEIYNEAITLTTATFDVETKSVEDRAAWLETHDERHPVLVAETGEGVVGWASLSPWSDRKAYRATGEVTFYVLAACRGQGIGRLLQDGLIAHAVGQGFRTLIALVTAGNDASMKLCESSGFEHVGTLKRVGDKFGQLLDVHILQKMLVHGRSPD